MADGDTITAALFNDEFNRLLTAFSYASSSTTGHQHDGTAGEGGNIHTIGDQDFLNKIVADSTNNRWGFFVEVSSSAVEQIRIQDGAIVPVTDNDIDLGTSSLEFKDAYFDGTVTTDGLTVSGTTNLDGAIQLDNTLTAGVDGTGYDIKFFGDTAGSFLLWDQSDDALELTDSTPLKIGDSADMQIYHDGSNSYVTNSTGALKLATETSGIAVTIGHGTSETTVADNLTVTGNVSVGGNLDVTGTIDLSDSDFTNAGDMQLDSISGDGDTNTSITFSGSDVITITAGGETQFTFNNGSILPTTDNDIDLGSSSYEFKDGYFDGTVYADAINYNGTAISATAAELNTLDGVTAVVGELNALDLGATGTGTAIASKAVILDANKDYTGIRNLTLAGDLTISGDDLTMGTNTSGHILVADGTNFNPVAVTSLVEIGTAADDDVLLAVDTSGGGLKKITRSAIIAGTGSSGDLANVVEDTSPQLGGNLDTNSQNILIDDAHFIGDENGNEQIIFQTTGSAVNQFDVTNAASGNPPKLSATGDDSNIDLDIEAKGTGHVTVRGNSNAGAIQFNCESNSHGQIVQSQPHSAGVTNTLLLPAGSSSTLVSLVSTDTLTNKTLTSAVLNTGVSGSAVLDEDNMASDSATKIATQQSIKAYVDSQINSTEFVLEDDDGTEVTVANAKEVKFIGSGITTNWTDTDNGTDGDPYDLTFTVDAAQTGITSLLATDIKIGEDDQTKIDFETADEIHFYAANAEQVYVADGIFGPQTDNDVDLGASGVEWKDAYFDGTVTTDALVADTADINGGSIDGATLGTNSAITQAVIDNVNINGATIGHTDDTDLITLADGIVTVAGEVSLTTLDIGGTNVTSTAAELNALDGITAVVGELNALDIGATAVGTAVASKAVILDSNKDYTGIRNLTITGELDAATLDVSGNVDIDGTLEADGITSNSVAVKVGGKETIWVPAVAMYPETTNGCADIAQVELSNGPEIKCLDFATGADDFAQFTVAFPKSWNEGTVTFQAFWTVTGTNTGTVAWALAGGSMANDASINTAFGTAVVATALAHSGTSNDMMVSAESGAVTIANAAVNTVTYFQVSRDVSADDQSGDARLLGIKLFFTTDAANDA